MVLLGAIGVMFASSICEAQMLIDIVSAARLPAPPPPHPSILLAILFPNPRRCSCRPLTPAAPTARAVVRSPANPTCILRTGFTFPKYHLQRKNKRAAIIGVTRMTFLSFPREILQHIAVCVETAH